MDPEIRIVRILEAVGRYRSGQLTRIIHGAAWKMLVSVD
jgi:hypothetical protein